MEWTRAPLYPAGGHLRVRHRADQPEPAGDRRQGSHPQPDGQQHRQHQTCALTAGWHTIQLFYIDRANYSHIYLYWTPPGQGQSIIPSAFLWPEMGTYPSVPESGGWPTLAEAQGKWSRRTAMSQRPATRGRRTRRRPIRRRLIRPRRPRRSPPTPHRRPRPTPGRARRCNPLPGAGQRGAAAAAPRGRLPTRPATCTSSPKATARCTKFGPDGKPLTSWPVTGARTASP